MNSKVKDKTLGKGHLLPHQIPYNLTLTQKYGRGEEKKSQKGIQSDYCKNATFSPITLYNLEKFNKKTFF